jgi:hypothetical protein
MDDREVREESLEITLSKDVRHRYEHANEARHK